MYEITCILVIIFGVLQIILFFKLWKMTDNVKDIMLTIRAKEARELGLPRKVKLKKDGKEVDAYDVEGGKILCAIDNNGDPYSEAFDYDEVELC